MPEIITSLLNYAFSHGIGVEYTDKLHAHTQSFTDVRSKSIIINGNWYKQKQLPFIIAHEISHALECNQNDAILSFSTLLTTKYEQKANINAIKLLIPFYADDKDLNEINVNEFMKLFEIPDSLKDVCIKELKNYFDF